MTIRSLPKRRVAAGALASAALQELIRKEVLSGVRSLFRENIPGGGGPGNSGATPPFIPSSTSSGVPGVGDGMGGKRMEDMIDQMVAASLMNGRHTTGILRVLFGIVPNLIGR